MRKSCLTVFGVAVLFLLGGLSAFSQQSRVAEREAEWNQYVLPQSTFERHTDSSKAVLFRAPSDWKRLLSDDLEFSGPHDASLKVIVEKIPDGSPLQSYVSAIMQSLRGISDSPDSIVVRATTMSGMDAREIMFESDEGSAEVSRRIIWCTVRGPNAVSIILIAPIARVAEIEPYLKAVVQSVSLLHGFDYETFNERRASAIKETKPQRVDEVQSLVASLSTLGPSTRQASVAKLASIFASSPDTAIDLVLDRRPMVRATVFEAIAQSRNSELDKFLLEALNDQELFVAEQAARSVAGNPNIIALLRSQSFDWFNVRPLVRVWPFLNRTNQIKILEELFAQPLVPASTVTRAPKVQNLRLKKGVTVTATVLPPGSAPVQVVTATSDPDHYLTGLTLLKDLPASEFKLPLNAILTAKNDSLTILALLVSWGRDELLPPAELFKLLTSSNEKVRRLAALHLGQSAAVSDIKTIEAYATKPATDGQGSDSSKPAAIDEVLANDLQLTITRIRLREELSSLSGEARQQLIQKNLADPKLAEWIWYRYVKTVERSDSR
ncbi:MAG TPA: hypothetical protein VI750_05310, partial [Pyrinomonadaceae bacterium]|nr:hypothetical protein [Pyrinomonadaceae bacterium]